MKFQDPCWQFGCRPAVLTLAILASVALFVPQAVADLVNGTKTVTLFTADGEKQVIGQVELKPGADGTEAAFSLGAPEFENKFLSMRPFQCLTDPKEWWCHLEYPWGLRKHISKDDLTDLEYQLLFLFKPPSSFGVDAWNGLYFKLAVEDDGVIRGDVHEVDLNELAVEPKEEFARPITPSLLTKVKPTSHRFARIEIK